MVCASIPSGRGASGAAGSVGICPVRITHPSLSTAWENGATGRGPLAKRWKSGMGPPSGVFGCGKVHVDAVAVRVAQEDEHGLDRVEREQLVGDAARVE